MGLIDRLIVSKADSNDNRESQKKWWTAKGIGLDLDQPTGSQFDSPLRERRNEIDIADKHRHSLAGPQPQGRLREIILTTLESEAGLLGSWGTSSILIGEHGNMIPAGVFRHSTLIGQRESSE